MSHRPALNISTQNCSYYKNIQSPIHIGEDCGLQGTLALAMTDCRADDDPKHTEYCVPQSFVSEIKSSMDSTALSNWQQRFKTVNNNEPSRLYDSFTSYEWLSDSSALSTPLSLLEFSDYEHTGSSDNEQVLRSSDYFPVVSVSYTGDPPADAYKGQDPLLLVSNSNLYTNLPTNLTPPCSSNNKGSQEAAVNSDLWPGASNSASRCRTLAEMSPMQIESFLQHCATFKANSIQQLKYQTASTKIDKQQPNAYANYTPMNCEYNVLSCKDFLDRAAYKPRKPAAAHSNGQMTSTFIGRSNSGMISISYAAKANPPRPPNAFILFRCERQRKMQQMHPDKTMQEISKMLGDIWNQEPADSELKQRFKRLAATEREVHKKIWPNYKYTCGKRRAKRKSRKTSGEHVTGLI